MSVRDYMIKEGLHDFPVVQVEDIDSRYRDYKIMHEVYDYTDMLVLAMNADFETPHLVKLMVDEAQDLSRLQWILVNRMASTADSILIAGDDKQSINLFSGADVETFLHLPGKVHVLEQSYRVPKQVFTMANKVMKHMRNYRKEGAQWKPKAEEGTAREVSSIPYHKMTNGSWLILGRTTYSLADIAENLIRMSDFGSLIFTVNNNPPIDMDILRAIDLFEVAEITGHSLLDLVQLKDDDSPEDRKKKIDYILLLKKVIHCKAGQPWEIDEDFTTALSKKWPVAFNKLDMATVRYISRLYPIYKQKGDNIFDEAQVRLMTIHAAKGREADNVLVLLDAPKTVQEVIREDDSDVEAKTLYVGLTRARKNLYIHKKNKRMLGLEFYL